MEYLKFTPSEKTGEILSARSLQSYQCCLVSYWRVLDHWGLVDPDVRSPFSSLLRRVAGQKKKADPREKKLRPMTREEAESLLTYIADNSALKYQFEMFVTVGLLWVTGYKLNEICGRYLSDIDDRGDHICISISEAKTEAGNQTRAAGTKAKLIADLKRDYEHAAEAWMDQHPKGFAVLRGCQAFFERIQRNRENAEAARVLGLQ